MVSFVWCGDNCMVALAMGGALGNSHDLETWVVIIPCMSGHGRNTAGGYLSEMVELGW